MTSPYKIQQSALGTFDLMLGNQLVMQATDKEHAEQARANCERVSEALNERGHAERNLVATNTKENH